MSNGEIEKRRIVLETWVAELRAKVEALIVEEAQVHNQLAAARQQHELASLLLEHLDSPVDEPRTSQFETRQTVQGALNTVRKMRNELAHGSLIAVQPMLNRPEEPYPEARMTIADAAYRALESIGTAAHYLQIIDEIRQLQLPVDAKLLPPSLLTSMKRDERIERVDDAPVRGIWAISHWSSARKSFDEGVWDAWRRAAEIAEDLRLENFVIHQQREWLGELTSALEAVNKGEDPETVIAGLSPHSPLRKNAQIMNAKGDEVKLIIEFERTKLEKRIEGDEVSLEERTSKLRHLRMQLQRLRAEHVRNIDQNELGGGDATTIVNEG